MRLGQIGLRSGLARTTHLEFYTEGSGRTVNELPSREDSILFAVHRVPSSRWIGDVRSRSGVDRRLESRVVLVSSRASAAAAIGFSGEGTAGLGSVRRSKARQISPLASSFERISPEQ
jgi:hypothetical protein